MQICSVHADEHKELKSVDEGTRQEGTLQIATNCHGFRGGDGFFDGDGFRGGDTVQLRRQHGVLCKN